MPFGRYFTEDILELLGMCVCRGVPDHNPPAEVPARSRFGRNGPLDAGELRAKGRCCAWCERKVRKWAVGSECVVLKVGGAVGGTVEHVCNSSGDCSVRLVGATSAAIFRADQVLPASILGPADLSGSYASPTTPDTRAERQHPA